MLPSFDPLFPLALGRALPPSCCDLKLFLMHTPHIRLPWRLMHANGSPTDWSLLRALLARSCGPLPVCSEANNSQIKHDMTRVCILHFTG